VAASYQFGRTQPTIRIKFVLDYPYAPHGASGLVDDLNERNRPEKRPSLSNRFLGARGAVGTALFILNGLTGSPNRIFAN